MTTANLSRTRRTNNAIASIRDAVLNHDNLISGHDLANERTFWEWADTYCEVHSATEGADTNLPRSLGRNTAYALYREIMSSLAEAADCDRRAERLLREALVERLRLQLEQHRKAHAGIYNAWRAATQDLAAMEGGAQ